MFFFQGLRRTHAHVAHIASIAAVLIAFAAASDLLAQQTATEASSTKLPPSEPQLVALPLPEDRGEAKLEQTLKQLGTTASVMEIVAHPDDEDGALLTYLSRAMGVRTVLY